MSTLTGKIKWYNGSKGYGFIERDDKEKDAFVHASAVKAAGMRYLNEGDPLEFTLEDGPKGPLNSNYPRKIILPFVRSYVDTETVTVSPCSTLILFLRSFPAA